MRHQKCSSRNLEVDTLHCNATIPLHEKCRSTYMIAHVICILKAYEYFSGFPKCYIRVLKIHIITTTTTTTTTIIIITITSSSSSSSSLVGMFFILLRA